MVTERLYTEADLRNAFREGWQTRNRSPGLKKVRRKNLGNAILASVGGSRHMEYVLVRDDRKYHVSMWLNSPYRKMLLKRDVA